MIEDCVVVVIDFVRGAWEVWGDDWVAALDFLRDEEVFNKEVFNKEVFDKEVFDKEVFDKEVFDKEVFDKN